MYEFLFLCLGIFLTSVFFWSKAPVAFEVPKVIFFQWFVRILVMVFGITFLAKKGKWKIKNRLLIPILIFTVWATATALLGGDIAKSFAGNFFRQDGLITFYELVGFSVLVSYFWKNEFKKMISSTIFLSVSFLSSWALIETINHGFTLGSAATFGNPVFLAGYLVCGLPFVYYFLRQIKLNLILKLLLFLLPVLTIVLTQASAAVAVMFIYLGVLAMSLAKKKYSYLFLMMGFVASFLITFFWLKDFSKEKLMSSQGRDRIYHRVIVGALKKPVTGWGWANVDYAFESNYWPLKVDHDVYVDKAHSQLLEVFTTTGFPGLVIYVYLFYVFFVELKSNYKKSADKLWNFTLISTVCLFILHSQTNIISIMEEILFWLVMGITLSESVGNQVQPASHGRRLKPRP